MNKRAEGGGKKIFALFFMNFTEFITTYPYKIPNILTFTKNI